MSWSGSTDNVGVTGYQIFRNGSLTPLGVVTLTGYADVSIAPATTYTYVVRALDAAGNGSPASNSVVTTTPTPLTIGSPAAGKVSSYGFFLQGQCDPGIDVFLSGEILASGLLVPCTSAGTYRNSILFTGLPGPKTITVDQVNRLGVQTILTRGFVLGMPPLVTGTGTHTEFRDFPADYFENSNVPLSEIVSVSDRGYLLLGELSSGYFPPAPPPYPPAFQLIAYEPLVFGTNGFPMRMGNPANPVNNVRGDFYWDVLHEMGHNFWNCISYFYIQAVPGPFLQESSACLSAEYVFQRYKEDPAHYGASTAAYDSMMRVSVAGRAYFQARTLDYIAAGSIYAHLDVRTSQVLTHKLIQAGDLGGWSGMIRFKSAYANPLQALFTFWQNGVDEVEETTYAIAALNVAFQRDFRADFRALNFPIDSPFYQSVCTVLQAQLGGALSCTAAEGPALLP